MQQFLCVEIIKAVTNEPMPCENNPEISRPGLEALAKAKGCMSVHLGHEEKDPLVTILVNVWDTLRDHETFLTGTKEQTRLKTGFQMVMKKLQYLIHVYFSINPCEALKAPFTDISVVTFKDGVSRETFVPLLTTLIMSVNAASETRASLATWGPVMENPKQYVLMMGWENEESRKTVLELPQVQEALRKLQERAELDVNRIRLTMYKPCED